jgi:hypothetical protein
MLTGLIQWCIQIKRWNDLNCSIINFNEGLLVIYFIRYDIKHAGIHEKENCALYPIG